MIDPLRRFLPTNPLPHRPTHRQHWPADSNRHADQPGCHAAPQQCQQRRHQRIDRHGHHQQCALCPPLRTYVEFSAIHQYSARRKTSSPANWRQPVMQKYLSMQAISRTIRTTRQNYRVFEIAGSRRLSATISNMMSRRSFICTGVGRPGGPSCSNTRRQRSG